MHSYFLQEIKLKQFQVVIKKQIQYKDDLKKDRIKPKKKKKVSEWLKNPILYFVWAAQNFD